MRGRLCFSGRDSSSMNGSAKLSRIKAMPIHRHWVPLLNRSRYHGISSGRLPDQMISNCENEK